MIYADMSDGCVAIADMSDGCVAIADMSDRCVAIATQPSDISAYIKCDVQLIIVAPEYGLI